MSDIINDDSVENRVANNSSTIGEVVEGAWLGLNWATTRWYDTNWGMPNHLYYAGGVRTCNKIAERYNMQQGLRPVSQASAPINLGYKLGVIGYVASSIGTTVAAGIGIARGEFEWCYALLANPFALRTVRGILGSIFFGPKEG